MTTKCDQILVINLTNFATLKGAAKIDLLFNKPNLSGLYYKSFTNIIYYCNEYDNKIVL